MVLRCNLQIGLFIGKIIAFGYCNFRSAFALRIVEVGLHPGSEPHVERITAVIWWGAGYNNKTTTLIVLAFPSDALADEGKFYTFQYLLVARVLF